ncbi:hypothetical protein SBADM41S_01988 [Streptomyces badius]
MYGSGPMYRTLKPGDKGRDVEQLERNLAELGYTGFTPDQEYTELTAAAVKRWQKSHDARQTGKVGRGRHVRPGEGPDQERRGGHGRGSARSTRARSPRCAGST